MPNGFCRDTTIMNTRYEDLVSLKKWMKDENYTARRLIRRKYKQTGTAGAVEVQDPSGETIAQVGATAGVTMTVIGAGAEKLADNGKIITAVFIGITGVETTHTATIAATFHDTAMAFTAAATAKLALKSLRISASSANDITVVSGGTTYGTITAGATAATEAQLFGVQTPSVHQKTDQVATDGETESYLKYRTQWGAKKYMVTTLGDTNTATQIIIPLEATWDEASKTFTASTVQVKDFYRLIEWEDEMAATDELLLCDVTGAAAVYNVIPATYNKAVFSRYMVPYDTLSEHAFLASLKATVMTANITVALTYTEKGAGAATAESIPVNTGANKIELISEPVELEPLSEVTMTILGNTAVAELDLGIIEGIKA